MGRSSTLCSKSSFTCSLTVFLWRLKVLARALMFTSTPVPEQMFSKISRFKRSLSKSAMWGNQDGIINSFSLRYCQLRSRIGKNMYNNVGHLIWYTRLVIDLFYVNI